jgi:hypothetical protein
MSDLITIKIKMDHIDNVFISKSNPKKIVYKWDRT